jgi:uric acid transporter
MTNIKVGGVPRPPEREGRPRLTLGAINAEVNKNAEENHMLRLRYGVEDRPPPIQMGLFGLQHVLVMFVAMVTPPLTVGQLLNLPPEVRVTLVSSCMLGAGIGTLVVSLGVGFIGPRLPIVMGIWSPIIGQIVAITKGSSLGAATSTMLICGLIVVSLSPVYAKLRRFFPPVVVGTVLLVAGTALLKIGFSVAYGTNTAFFAKPITLVLLFSSIASIVVLNRIGRGLFRLLSLFITLVCTYAAAIPLGLANFDPVVAAPWFRIPTPFPYGWDWPNMAGIVAVLLTMMVAAVEATGVTLAVCDVVGIKSSERHIFGVISADGLCSAISAAFGGMPLVSFAQNFGALTLTGVGSRFAVAAGGAILLVMALVPKIGAILTMVPPFIIGGTLIFTFGMIAAVGIGILAGGMKGPRDAILVAASMAMSGAATFMPPQVLELITPSLRVVLSDGIVMGMITAFLLNLVMPSDKTVEQATAASRP